MPLSNFVGAVDAQLHGVGGIAHLLLGGEDDFRTLQHAFHGDFGFDIHHPGGDGEAEIATSARRTPRCLG